MIIVTYKIYSWGGPGMVNGAIPGWYPCCDVFPDHSALDQWMANSKKRGDKIKKVREFLHNNGRLLFAPHSTVLSFTDHRSVDGEDKK